MPKVKPVLLVVLDGWGIRAEREANAIAIAGTPNMDALVRDYPSTALRDQRALAVGLPEGQMGNSEVGHTNLGAGRIVYQDLVRINRAIEDGSFFQNAALLEACRKAKAPGGALHLMGLVSDGGVHSQAGAPARAASSWPGARGWREGLRPRLPRRPRHAAEERRSATSQSLEKRHEGERLRQGRHRHAAATSPWTATSAGTG